MLGISYKDAAHRLYMAELERLKADGKHYEAFAKLQASTKTALENAMNSLKQIGENSDGNSEENSGLAE